MTYQIPVFANGARGSAAFFFVFFNPIKLTDPDGRKIRIPNVVDRSKVLGWINNVAANKFAIDEDGYLVRDGNEFNGLLNFGADMSREYSARLEEGIAASGTIDIKIDSEYLVETQTGAIEGRMVAKKGEGVTVQRKNGNVEVYISGNNSNFIAKDKTTQESGPDEILVHEMTAHAVSIIAPNPMNKNTTIERENRVRSQMAGWKERLVVPHPGD